MDDVAVLVAQAIAKRAKESLARQGVPAPGGATAAPKAAAPAVPKTPPPPPAPAPRPPAAAPSQDVPLVVMSEGPQLMSTLPLLGAFAGGAPLLTAFVLHEALGKPVALREDGPHF